MSPPPPKFPSHTRPCNTHAHTHVHTHTPPHPALALELCQALISLPQGQALGLSHLLTPGAQQSTRFRHTCLPTSCPSQSLGLLNDQTFSVAQNPGPRCIQMLPDPRMFSGPSGTLAPVPDGPSSSSVCVRWGWWERVARRFPAGKEMLAGATPEPFPGSRGTGGRVQADL